MSDAPKLVMGHAAFHAAGGRADHAEAPTKSGSAQPQVVKQPRGGTPYRHVWLVLWVEQDTQRSGVHGVFNDENSARTETERANYNTIGRVYRAEQWPINS